MNYGTSLASLQIGKPKILSCRGGSVRQERRAILNGAKAKVSLAISPICFNNITQQPLSRDKSRLVRQWE
jgi:hypothetical protein